MSTVDWLSGPPGCFLEEDAIGYFCCDRGKGSRISLRLAVGEGVCFRYFLYIPPTEGDFQRAVEINLTGPGARVEVYGLALGSVGRSVLLDISLRHSASDSHSLCQLRSIDGERSDISFVGRVTVPRGALRCSSSLQNRNLRIFPSAKLRAVPILDIAAPDARCSHGTTVGGLDKEQLFYMRSRGLGQDCARALICDAFIDEIIRHFPPDYGSAPQWIGL
ncbi:MAG: SufD family Fe-S cluster assembly protein [Puniceicoccales bacterium]|nr:SufD family Fe-S cluster assembly protein [Puniceicoccales bacterium]